MSAPSRPVLFEPSPCRPRWALYSGLKRKVAIVVWLSLDSIMTSPPLPPSPPEGPPRGTNFSRRNARQPLPPSPAFTRIVASSMNMDLHQRKRLTVPSVHYAKRRQSFSPFAICPATRNVFGWRPSPHNLNEPKSLYHLPSGTSGCDSIQ